MEHKYSLTAPVLLAALICCVAPFWGDIQEFLKVSLGSGFAPVFAVAFLLSAGSLLVLVVRRITERRVARFAMIVLALALAAVQIVSTDRGFAEIPERMHLPLYGLLSFLFYRAFLSPERRLGRWASVATILAVVFVGLLDEWVQTIVVARTGELYDVTLNLFAGVLGYLVAIAYFNFEGLAGSRSKPTAVAQTLAWQGLSIALAFGLLFHAAHAGYRIDDPELGTFFTYVHPDRFLEINRDRAERWRSETPGPDWRPLELQDNYRIEAGWRTQHRNSRFEEEDWFPAWREHLILEKYFPAFLASPNRRGETYAYSAEQIETLRRNAKDDGRFYLSPAGLEPKRVFARPSKSLLWSIICSIVVLCALTLVWTRRSNRESE